VLIPVGFSTEQPRNKMMMDNTIPVKIEALRLAISLRKSETDIDVEFILADAQRLVDFVLSGTEAAND